MSYTIEQWIDEMQILRADKIIRIQTAKKIKKQMSDFFAGQLNDLQNGRFLKERSSSDYVNMLIDIYMTYSDSKSDEWMRGRAERFAKGVQKTTENAVRKNESTPEFTSAILFGIPIKKDDIPKKVLDTMSEDRAKRIAMNETNVINNYKHHSEIAKTQATHTWDATLDAVTRTHHWVADGQTVPINEPFIVGGERLMFPGDDSLGATAKNLNFCRCHEL